MPYVAKESYCALMTFKMLESFCTWTNYSTNLTAHCTLRTVWLTLIRLQEKNQYFQLPNYVQKFLMSRVWFLKYPWNEILSKYYAKRSYSLTYFFWTSTRCHINPNEERNCFLLHTFILGILYSINHPLL